ncbi:hypothetical protein JM47_02630 [Ureaplasma diversum]|uniref:Lipoprotein n=1 Tax=Ureaplasma diversum TaxID=42094 RepID=A0A0C5RLB1_9BACT|nr:hypothetical protein [Ureaplasma diversum]AJQ45453.1 hypothetical protein JM47_02630 [Ureaplasma diversum]
MTKARKILISSFILTTIGSVSVLVASCSKAKKDEQPKTKTGSQQQQEENKQIINQSKPKETKQEYNPNIFKFDNIRFKIAKEDNDEQLKTKSFLNEIKAVNQLDKYVAKKDDLYISSIYVFDKLREDPTFAKASVYINHHEPMFTRKAFDPEHLKTMVNTLESNKHWSIDQLRSEMDNRHEKLFFAKLKEELGNKTDFLDNIPDRLGKYHREELPPKPTEDDGFRVRLSYERAVKERETQREYFYMRKWTEEDPWHFYKENGISKPTLLWYLNRVIYGSDKWNTKFKESNHNNELFLSKLFYEKTLTKDQRQYWDMDFIMYNFMNQSSLLMSSGEQYDLYKAYLEYLVQLANLNLHQIQEKTENNKTVSKEEQYIEKLSTTVEQLLALERLALKTLQANHILGFSAATHTNPNLQLFAGNTHLKTPTNLRAFYMWTANLYNKFIQPLLHKLKEPASRIQRRFKTAFESTNKEKKIMNFIWENLKHTEQNDVILPKVITDEWQLNRDYKHIIKKLLNPKSKNN